MKIFLAFFFALWTVSQGLPAQKCIDEVQKYSKLAFGNVKTVCVKHKCKIAYAPVKQFLLKNFIMPIINDVEATLAKCKYTEIAIKNEVAVGIVKKCLDPELSKVNDLCQVKEDVLGNIKGCVMGQAMQLMPLLPNADAYCDCLLKFGLIKDLGTSNKHSYKKLISQIEENKSLCKK